MLGHLQEAVSLYMTHTDVDEETARAVVKKLAEQQVRRRRARAASPERVRRFIRRSIQLAPTVSVSPWAAIEQRIVKAATSKIGSRVADLDLRTNSANSIEATPFGPNQAMNSFWGLGRRLFEKASRIAAGRATSSASGMKTSSRQIVAVVADRDDQRAEDEERDHLEDRADVLGELDEGVGDLVLGGPHRDPGHEGGDQPIAERHVGQAERGEAEADRVDALVAGRDAAAREAVVEPAAERPRAPRPRGRRTPPRRGASPPRAPASPPGWARIRKKSTNGSASPSLRPDSRFSVWRTIAGTRWAVTTVEVTTGSVGVSTAASRNASAQVSGKIAFAASAQQERA